MRFACIEILHSMVRIHFFVDIWALLKPLHIETFHPIAWNQVLVNCRELPWSLRIIGSRRHGDTWWVVWAKFAWKSPKATQCEQVRPPFLDGIYTMNVFAIRFHCQ